MKPRELIIFLLLLVLHVFASFIINFTAWPEMLTYPKLIINGYNFYGDIIQPYLPLLPYLLALIYKIIGFSILSLRIVTIFFLLTSDILIYLITRKRYSIVPSLITLSSFIILSLLFEGNGLWFDLASLPLVLGAFYIIDNKSIPKNKWLAGLLLGLAFLIKQTNIIFTIPLLFNVGFNKGKLTYFLAALMSPFLFLAILYTIKGIGGTFFYWGIVYPLFVLPKSVGFSLVPTLKQLLVVFFVFSPLVLIRKSSALFWGFVLSLLFAFPRFAYFHLLHATAFFVLLLPQVEFYKKRFFFLCYGIGILFLLITFIKTTNVGQVRFFDAKVLAFNLLLNKAISKSSKVYFYNVSSNYWVFSDLLPIKPWADHFPWYLELNEVQENIVANIKYADYVAYKSENSGSQYELGVYKPIRISDYVDMHFGYIKNIDDVKLLQNLK